MDGRQYLDDVTTLYRQSKADCEQALSQVPDEALHQRVGDCPQTLAVLIKHVGGNLRSRWRDFLTTDGEKRDRDRESEFHAVGESGASIRATWDEGFAILFASLEGLEPADLERTITIRGQPLSVMAAIQRSLTHTAYHAGQIVQLARAFAGDAWQTLSIAPGQSDAFNAAMRERFGDWWVREEGGESPDVAPPDAGP